MSEQQDVDQTGYEADARRWLRVYPPRWRRAREDEVLGVLLDTRSTEAPRLPPRARLDLVRGSLVYRWRTRPPLLDWLLWRWSNELPGPAHQEWVTDDVNGRLWAVRDTWLSHLGLIAVAFFLVLSDLGRDVEALALAPLAFGVLMTLVPVGRRRSVLRQLARRDHDRTLAAHFDRSVPWRPRRRLAWDGLLLRPVAGLAVGSVVALAVVVPWMAGGHPGVDTDGLLTRPDPWLLLSLAPLGLLLLNQLLALLAVVRRVPRRMATRPQQPWREEVRPPADPLVLALTVGAGLVPVLAAALPLLVTVVPSVVSAPPGSPAADAAANAGGLSLLGLCLLVPALVLAPVALLLHALVARGVRAHPGPRPALVDVCGLRGGDRVPVDTPLLLGAGLWPAPSTEPPPAPGAAAHPSPGHH